MSPIPTLLFNRGQYHGQTVHFRRGYVILKVYAQDDSEASVKAAVDNVMGGTDYSIIKKPIGRWVYLGVDPGTDILTLVKDLNQNPQVQYAEPDLKLTASDNATVPRDPFLYSGAEQYQWAVPYLNLFEVWKTHCGDDSVLIGLIDSGVPIKGEVYDGSIALHDRLTAEIDHIDFDGSRFIAGYNLLTATPTEPPIVWPKDMNNYVHGTNMAGIIAAKENNTDDDGDYIGMAGVNWRSPVYVSVVMDSGGSSTIGLVTLAVGEILEYAASQGNPNVVLNLSINYSDQDIKDLSGTDGPGMPGQPILVDETSPTGTPATPGEPTIPDESAATETSTDPMAAMHQMFAMIVEAGAVICISVGNGDTGDDGILIEYPAKMGVETAAYAPHVIVVGATNHEGRIYEHSGRGVADMVFAPGEEVCTTDKSNGWDVEFGSSLANAHVSGLAALLWGVDSSLTAAEVVKCIKKTCRFPEHDPGDSAAEEEYLSYGIVDASAALQAITGHAELETPSIVFEDAEPGLDHTKEIIITVSSCRAATFTVTVSGHGFGIVPASYAHDPCSGTPFVLGATYSADDRDTEAGIVTVVWDQNTDFRWEIGISAARRQGRNAVCLVLDKSGSMGNPSGLESYSRLEVLQYSADLLVDLVDLDDGLGIVRFDSEAADLVPFTVISPENPDPDRALLKAGVASLQSGGTTSIASGIMAARDQLDSLPAGDNKAIILLTDGKETHAPWLEELSPEDIRHPLYAIGMGTAASIEPDDLAQLADLTAGYCVLTGSLDQTTEYDVASFLGQILADIAGDSVPFDPVQHIRPGVTHRFPVRLGEADKEAEIILMRPPGLPLEWKVLGPAGWQLKSDLIKTQETDRLVRIGFSGPSSHVKAKPPVNGIWQIVISTPNGDFTAWIRDLKNKNRDTRKLELHGASYTVRVHARSNLRMKCRVTQSGYLPDSIMAAEVRLSDRGRSLTTRPSVTAKVTGPRGGTRTVQFTHQSGGIYAASVEARSPGIYNWRITADGQTRAGHLFRRECQLTGAVWRASVTTRKTLHGTPTRLGPA